MSRVLKLSDHALKRWTEKHPSLLSCLPIKPHEVLDLDAAKNMVRVARGVSKALQRTVRVRVPDRARFWKWVKHGRTDEMFLWYDCESTLFILVPERNEDVMVTAAKVPTERRQQLDIEDTLSNPHGAAYLMDVVAFRVPYRWKSPLYKPRVPILHGRTVPLLSCDDPVPA